jgi:Spy/CpxP family protein refolding chaperone
MKRHHILLVLLAASLAPTMAQAQQRSPNPQTPSTEQLRVRVQTDVRNNVLQLVDLLNGFGGAWWTNTALIERLGLTEDQKTRIQRAFENHRLSLESSKTLLEKEEGQLGRLLEAETVDRGAILSQVDRVTQARSEMERSNSVMTLEMREVLTRAQWMQLSQGPAVTWFNRGDVGGRIIRIAPTVAPVGAGQRGGGARGARGQE